MGVDTNDVDAAATFGNHGAMTGTLPRFPVGINSVFDDPTLIEHLVDTLHPYWPVQRYMANRAEYATLSGGSAHRDPQAAMPVAPVFRGDWAFNGDIAPGVEPILGHPAFIDAARELFDAPIVRPHTVYANLTWQLPFPQGRGHADIPAFRGFDRTTVPVTFLTIMGQSGLFEAERVKVATAVAWLYAGADGGFEYWPHGPSGPSVIHEGSIYNTAVMGDNDFMWHRVRPTGRPDDGMVSLSLDDQLHRNHDGTWTICGPDGDVATFGRNAIRVSLSWKADVFDSDEDRRRHDDHLDDLHARKVFSRLSADLAGRGLDPTIPAGNPVSDPGFVSRLQDAYMHYPG